VERETDNPQVVVPCRINSHNGEEPAGYSHFIWSAESNGAMMLQSVPKWEVSDTVTLGGQHGVVGGLYNVNKLIRVGNFGTVHVGQGLHGPR
jgi:hypothetical protein